MKVFAPVKGVQAVKYIATINVSSTTNGVKQAYKSRPKRHTKESKYKKQKAGFEK